MVIEDCRIVSNKSIGASVFKMEIYCPSILSVASPGQFLHLKISDSYDPLLRRPLSICSLDVQKGLIVLIYKVIGKGTELLSVKRMGDTVNVIGPLGKGFPIYRDKKTAIIGGGIGIAPLLELSKHLNYPDIYLGFKNDVFLIEDFKEYSKTFYLYTEDGSNGEKGFPTNMFFHNIDKYEIVYTCGPKAMIATVKDICEENNVECYISMEEKMGCGIGACLTCSCKTNNKGKYKKVCIDGPVFNSKEVVFHD